MENEKSLYYLEELSAYKVASEDCDVRGWEVVAADGRAVGTVDGLLVHKQAERVVYLDVELNKDLIKTGHEIYAVPANQGTHDFIDKDGEDHLILPIGMVDLDEDGKRVVANEMSYDSFAKIKKFGKGADINRQYEIAALRSYLPSTVADDPSPIDKHFYDGREFENRLQRKDR